jgi:DNA end-binding protein Ku
MARPIWSGSISFGLVNVPVRLYSATQDHEVHFHQFEKGTSSRVRNQRVNEDTGDEVDYQDVVKGADIGDGEYVMLTQDELESVEPGRSGTIDISDFVDAAEIDPIYFQKAYYLGPSDDSAKKAYSLLVKAMDQAKRIGIATFVMRGKQYLAAIRPYDGMLLLETMFFADEVRDPAEQVDNLPVRTRVASKDVEMAVRLVETLTTRWKPQNYRDTYTERVQQLIDAKKKDREIVVPETTVEAGGKVSDLLSALEASVDAAKNHRAGNTAQVTKLKTRKKHAAQKKSTPKKSTAKRSSGSRRRKAS